MSIITKIKKKSECLTNDINYACICNKYFKNNLKVVILYPCSHILHSTCYKKKNKTCPICNEKIEKIIHEDDLYKQDNNDKVYRQMIINLESIRLDSSKSVINYHLLPINIIKFTSYINKLLLATDEADVVNSTDFLFNLINMKINVIDNTHNNPIIYTSPANGGGGCGGGGCGGGCGGGEGSGGCDGCGGGGGEGRYITWKNHDDKNKKKILIVNHSHYLDSFVLYYLFRAGFVASEFLNTLDIGRLIAQKCKLLIFKRGVDTNMVTKIKEYLEEKKTIVIFPEGSMGSNNSIRKFRTGAFYADAHICPIVIKYNPFVWDDDYKTFILKVISQKEIVVDIHVNDLHAPPFSTEQIQKIRSDMLTMGQMKDSHVSNRGFKD
jgi:hypothetical protein